MSDPLEQREPAGLRGGLGRALMQSHFRVALIGVVMLAMGLVATIYMRDIARQLLEEAQPRQQTINTCQVGVQQALASLRGWILVADERSRIDRRVAWEQLIYPAMDRLETLYADEDLGERDQVLKVRGTLRDLEAWQWYTEEVAHTPGNMPVRAQFVEQLEPVYQESLARCHALTGGNGNETGDSGAGQVLGNHLVDFLYAYNRGHQQFRAFAESLNPSLQPQAVQHRDFVSSAVERVARPAVEGRARQAVQLDLLKKNLVAYVAISDQVLGLAADGQHQVAEQRLERECMPRARVVLAMLGEIAAREDQRSRGHARTISVISRLAPPAFGGLLIIMLATAYVTSRRGAGAVTRRVGTLVSASQDVARGTLQTDIPIEGSDELSLLADSFNRMRATIQDREASLQDKEEQSRLIIESATDAMVMITEQGTVRSFNAAAVKMFGYTAEEVIGKNVNMLMPSPHAEQHDGYLRRYLETGEAKIIGLGRDVEARHKDGHLIFAHLGVSEVRVQGERLFNGIITDLSEMRAAQEALHAERERFNLAVQGSSDGIWDWDIPSNAVYFSPRFKALLGYEDHEIENEFREFEIRLHPDDHAPTMEAVKRHLEQRVPYDVEYRLKRKDGVFAWYLARGQAIWDADGVPVRMAGSLSDITLRKKAQDDLESFNRQLERQNRMQSRLVELNECVRGVRDPQGMVNRLLGHLVERTGALLGALYLVDEEDGTLYHRVATHAVDLSRSSGESIQAGMGLVGQVAQDGKLLEIDDVPSDYFYIQSSTGGMAPAYALLVPMIHDEDVVAVLELAAVKPLDRELIRYLERAAEVAASGLRGAQLNHRTEQLLVRTREQSEELQNQQEEMLATNEELQAQTEALQVSQGRLQEQQEELQAMNEELEEQKEALEVKNCLVERANQDLGRSAENLLQANRYKNEFLANMSHELRTPLNSMLILSRLLEGNSEGNLTDKQVEFAHTIHKSGNDLLNLINDILDLSKVEAGKLEVHWGPCSLAAIVAQFKQQFEPVAADKGVALVIDHDDTLPQQFTSDGQRLEQILRNLASNAFKFTSEGSVTLEIGRPNAEDASGFKRLSQSNPSVIAFRLRDTGIGIPEEKRQLIFEAFQQADGGTSRNYGGTGLGLSISREFSNLLGGEIHLQSTPGEGSCFSLFLPEKPPAESAPSVAAAELEIAEPVASTVESIASDEPVTKTGRTNGEFEGFDMASPEGVVDDIRSIIPGDASILIVEDDLYYANVLGELAHKKGFKRLIACDGVTGLHYAFKYRPHAILLDGNLPELNGPALLERLKANPDTRDIPVHFVTGRDDLEDFRERGAVGLLKKPVSTEDLLEAFERIQNYPPEGVKRVLVVDRNPAQRQAIVDLVSEADRTDIEVMEADTVEAAESLLSEARFDCMILDYTTEGEKDFFDLLEHLREQEHISHPPVIIHSQEWLSENDANRLHKYADSIVIKGAHSPERLLDEATLFLHEVRTHLTEKQKDSMRKLHAQHSGLGEKTVLLVDDDLRNAYALNSALEEQGLRVVIKMNGREALDWLDEVGEVDIVLMDIMMPVMDGFETMRAMRKQRRFKDIPIIALTAKAMKDDRERCIEAGASDYLPKPVDIDRLISLIHVWVQHGVRS